MTNAVANHHVLWAKFDNVSEPYPLLAHLLDTATAATCLFNHWLRKGLRDRLSTELGPDAEKILGFVAGIHDLGKANPYFQAQRRNKKEEWITLRDAIQKAGFPLSNGTSALFEETKEKRRHENITLSILGWEITKFLQVKDVWPQLAIIGHHGNFSAPGFLSDEDDLEDIEDIFDDNGWSPTHELLVSSLLQAVGLEKQPEIKHISPASAILISGLVVLADRIASQSEMASDGLQALQKEELFFHQPEKWIANRKAFCREIIENTVGTYHPWESEAAGIRAVLGDYEPRFTQKAALNAGDGLFNVMETTGAGKTEAALLRHVKRKERLLFFLPTQATTNAIMDRIGKIFDGTPNVASLAHGLAVTEDFYAHPILPVQGSSDDANYKDNGGLYPTEFVRSAGTPRLLAPVCVGTIDQALMGALPSKFNHLRLLALANAHVVVDEVHTMDQYQSELMSGLLEWWSATDTPVTLLTATMPAWQREKFHLSYTGKDPHFKGVFPSLEDWSTPSKNTETSQENIPTEAFTIPINIDKIAHNEIVDSHVQWVIEQRKLFPQARIGIICNTVGRAQSIAEALAHESPIVLHSRMTAGHRKEAATKLEQAIGKKGTANATLVIGTQAIEASLDIDLDLLRTELCPAPSLIQRAGRLWRRLDPQREVRVPGMVGKKLTIAVVDSPSTGQTLPYLRSQLYRVESWLKQRDRIEFPADIQDFIDATTPGLQELFQKVSLPEDCGSAEEREALADDYLNEVASWVTKQRQAGTSRIDFAKHGKPRQVLASDCVVEDFLQITSANNLEESATRLIDYPSISAILCDPTGTIPGAWTDSVEKLIAISAKDSESLRRALRASISIPHSKKFLPITSREIPLSEAKTLLSGYSAVHIQPDEYDLQSGLKGPQK
ncbi:CRISPR-associated helicase/endonuclease Cas3 [Corynebacterium ulcerans]|uniref:CRISPR-associated helicase/endonuclease Cas3 n=1 Tax=Corynebacterium ulcerans TaxID=65058 RepID=UPI00021415C1|nr:CRISPR-associated helicase/endonuclease Cas3 [Corynebacterium ulcerans]AEG82752.1 CRISPR-associated protein [Corynebacterium ulcerans BR-AD22]NOL58846.1 CRISPR-associated helicase/endonuclease Cas3 [Corynebacterium ulcerans]NOM03373.1 CRISPR-associated helicase/endonuclease Cas3 [Corynebacterium ulcerans]